MRADIAVKIKKDKIKESAPAPLCPPNDEGKNLYFYGKERKEKKSREQRDIDGYFRKL